MVVERAERKKRRRREKRERWEGSFYTSKNTYLPKVPSCLALSLIVNVTWRLPNSYGQVL
jgi:hypothetical protein